MVIFALHLETAFLASTLSCLVFVIGFILIKFLAKSIKGITFWVIAYACCLFEYGFLFLLNGPWQLFFEFLFAVLFRTFLILGMKKFFDFKISKKFWGIFLSLIVICDILLVFMINYYNVFLYTFSFINGSLCIYSALIIFQYPRSVIDQDHRGILVFIGSMFLLSGIHLYDYPFLRPVDWFAPIGYMISFCLAQAMAVGLLIIIFQKINHINMKSKETIAQLEGLLPICASCKKIRDVQGYWNQLEDYFLNHSEVKFTHSLCDECIIKLYPDILIEKL
jgi:hypothetical protein